MKRSKIYRQASDYLFDRTKGYGICCAIRNTTGRNIYERGQKELREKYPELMAVCDELDNDMYWFDGSSPGYCQVRRKHRAVALLFAAHMAEDTGN